MTDDKRASIIDRIRAMQDTEGRTEAEAEQAAIGSGS